MVSLHGLEGLGFRGVLKRGFRPEGPFPGGI